jgi:hypothetical protein
MHHFIAFMHARLRARLQTGRVPRILLMELRVPHACYSTVVQKVGERTMVVI